MIFGKRIKIRNRLAHEADFHLPIEEAQRLIEIYHKSFGRIIIQRVGNNLVIIMEEKLKIIKYAPPPSDLPIYGQVDPKEVCFFGRTNYESEFEIKKYIFGIKRADRRRHMYIIGKSGVGKTKFLELLLRQDISYGRGICLMDLHGDIINNILDFIPEERIQDVIIIDPSDINWPASFNPLQNVASEMKHQVTQGLIEVLKNNLMLTGHLN